MSKSGYKRNYIVVKLWATILLLVTVVLFILSLLLMQFFRSYIMEDVKDTLTNTASKIAVTLEQHTNLQFGLEVAREILDDNTRVVIVTDKEHVYYSNESDADYFNIDYFQNDPKLSKVFTKHQNVSKELDLSKDKEQVEPGLMIGVPLSVNNTEGAVFIYQSLDVMNEAIRVTTRIILWSALIAFVLTTFFALFLSTRVTAPLRKMRESASEVAKGRFDVKVPILTHDEIGELAKTFNQMRRQLKINMTALKQEKEQLSSILKSMADGVITINKKGEILVTNPPAERFLKTWALANKQKNDPSEVPPKIFEQLSKAIETEKEQSGEITFQNTYWSFIVSPQFDDETIRGAVVVLRDMTEERKLEKLREDFIANVSHELRTPIAMLQGYSEALMDDVASSEEEEEKLRVSLMRNLCVWVDWLMNCWT